MHIIWQTILFETDILSGYFANQPLYLFSAPHHHGDEGHHGKKNDVSHCLKVLNDTSILSNYISTLPSSVQSSV